MMRQSAHTSPIVLVILDGFGLAPANNPGNAITPKTAPFLFSAMKKYSSTTLSASGVDVGLFPGQQGNSEAGHIAIGAGRVVEQDLVRISHAIHDGTFFKNHAFKQALFHAKKYDTSAHVMALLTDDNSAHARPEHLYAILEFFRRENFRKVFLHLFTDGRDSSPHEAGTFLHELRGHMLAHEKIASIAGRLYAMDRNKIWERTKLAYDALIEGKGRMAHTAESALTQSYDRGDTDEFVLPTVIEENGKPVAEIRDNDVVYFMNARSDRARQLTKAFVQTDEEFAKDNPGSFHRLRHPKNMRFVALTDFGPDLPGIFTAFPSPDVPHGLSAAIGDRRSQLYISETEKYAHVTYFINGGYATPRNGEVREVVPSPHVRSYAEKPEMNTLQLLRKVLAYIADGHFDFLCVNIPNADMVGHTGDFVAGKKAIGVVDDAVKAIADATLARDGLALVVGDHGNAEMMINTETGEVDTEHTTNPVPCIIIRKGKKRTLKKGLSLTSVAPTLLKLMDIPVPKEMTGKILS